tara:strand:+ start:409 stop:696 length:288 start_codon:yes stop_codon:yes gene_type:complete
MTLLEHIKLINAEAAAKMEEEEGLVIGMITEDLEHWAGYGIRQPNQLDRYFTEQAVYNMHKSVYGFRCKYSRLTEMSDEELDEELKRLSMKIEKD